MHSQGRQNFEKFSEIHGSASSQVPKRLTETGGNGQLGGQIQFAEEVGQPRSLLLTPVAVRFLNLRSSGSHVAGAVAGILGVLAAVHAQAAEATPAPSDSVPAQTPPDAQARTTGAAADAPSEAAEMNAVQPNDANGGADRSEPADAESEPLGKPHNIALDQAETFHGPAGLPVVAQLIEGAPSVTVCSAFDAGARRDPRSRPGLNRLLAEMLKNGGYPSKQQDYAALIEERGGSTELFYSSDASVFCTTVPSNELELALWLAGSRYAAAGLSDKSLSSAVEQLASQAEERDAAVHTGRAPDRLRSLAFLGAPALGHNQLASPEELDLISLDELRDAHADSYVAARSTLVVVGGGTSQLLQSGLSKYFGYVKAGQNLDFEVALVPQHTARFSMAEDKAAKTPAAWYGWVAASASERDVLNATLQILLADKRLGGKLNQGAKPARSFALHLDDAPHGPGLARLEVVGRGNSSLGTIEQELDAELVRLVQGGPAAQELSELKQKQSAAEASGLATAQQRALQLARRGLAGETAAQILAPLAPEYEAPVPSAEQIRSAAARLLSPYRRNTVEIYPKGWQDPWQAPMPLFHIVEKGQTLSSIARQYGTTVAVVTKMNGLKESKPIYPGDKLKVPRGHQKKEKPARTHTVRRGDTLSGLAVKYGVSVREIADANGMGSRQTIRTGESLTIPWSNKESSAPTSSNSKTPAEAPQTSQLTHKVSSGETLSGIAQHYGVGTVALARENGISQKTMVRVGQVLKVPPRGTGKPSAAVDITHTVKKGDTLSGIAKRYGVSVAAITVANGMSRTSTLRVGQKIKIPQKND